MKRRLLLALVLDIAAAALGQSPSQAINSASGRNFRSAWYLRKPALMESGKVPD